MTAILLGCSAIAHAQHAASDRWHFGDTGSTFDKRRSVLWDASFINARTGVAIGYSGALRTDDGGLTWRELPIGTISDSEGRKGSNWYNVRMVSSNEIWALGHYHPGGPQQTRLTRSLDGGETWEDLLPGQVAWAGGRLHFPTPRDRWVIVGDSPSFHSADGGASWREINWGRPVFVSDIVFPAAPMTPTTGFAVGFTLADRAGCVLKTEDGGLTWEQLTLPAETPPLRRTYFPTPFEGWVGGDGGRILYTGDGGQTWEDRSVDAAGQRIWALLMLPCGGGFAAFQNQFGSGTMLYSWTLFSTADGGRNWQPELGGFRSIHALCKLRPDLILGVGWVPGHASNDLVVMWERQ